MILRCFQVTPVLPWLLVSSTHLSLRDLTHLASYRCLSALLELGLVSSSGTYTSVAVIVGVGAAERGMRAYVVVVVVVVVGASAGAGAGAGAWIQFSCA